FKEEPADRGAGPLGRDQDHVDVLGRHDSGLVAVDNAEAVREIQRLTGSQVGLDGRPLLLLACIREQVLDNGAALGGFFEGEQALAGYPAILHRQVPAAALVLAEPDDDRNAVVLHVQGLTAPLDAVAKDGHGFPAQDLLQFLGRIVGPFHHDFAVVSYLDLAHGAFSLESSLPITYSSNNG